MAGAMHVVCQHATLASKLENTVSKHQNRGSVLGCRALIDVFAETTMLEQSGCPEMHKGCENLLTCDTACTEEEHNR